MPCRIDHLGPDEHPRPHAPVAFGAAEPLHRRRVGFPAGAHAPARAHGGAAGRRPRRAGAAAQGRFSQFGRDQLVGPARPDAERPDRARTRSRGPAAAARARSRSPTTSSACRSTSSARAGAPAAPQPAARPGPRPPAPAVPPGGASCRPTRGRRPSGRRRRSWSARCWSRPPATTGSPAGPRGHAADAGAGVRRGEHLTEPDLGPERLAPRAQRLAAPALQGVRRGGPQPRAVAHRPAAGGGPDGARLPGPPPVDRRDRHACGFRDPSHFTRRFRAAYGMTPRDWQQVHRRE